MTSHLIKLSASVRVVDIANGDGGGAGGKCLCVENTAVIEVGMLIGYMIPNVPIHPAFDWVGSCTPFVGGATENVKAFWVGETELHRFDR